MLNDALSVIKWWLYILLLGIIFLPLTQKYFHRFFDRGYAFSKLLGTVIAGFTVWVLGALKLVAFSRASVFVVLLVFIGINVYIRLRGARHEARGEDGAGVRGAGHKAQGEDGAVLICVLEELVFLGLLLFWCYIRGIKPDIFGLEKFMDFGFINALLRSDFMPAVDIWFAGKGINYYYFGHYIAAFLTRLTNMDSAVTYNLMLATLLAETFVFSFSLVGNIIYTFSKEKLKKAVIAGIIAAVMVTFAGNLHGFIYAYAKPFIQKNITHEQIDKSYYYPNSTRYIGYNPETNDKTIHEFPIYSFVVSDVHGHVSDIPLVLTFIALLLAAAGEYVYEGKVRKRYIVLCSLLLAAMYMTNAWDYPIYFTVMVATVIGFGVMGTRREVGGTGNKASVKVGLLIILVFVLSQILLIPFNMSFDMISNQVRLVMNRTPLYQLLVLWGHQFFFSFSFIGYIVYRIVKYYKRTKIDRDSSKSFKAMVNSFSTSDIFCFILTVCALGLILLPEIVFVVDIYVKNYHRANTMFKLTFQAFILFGLSIGYIAVVLVSRCNKRLLKTLLIAVFSIFLLLPMLYPFMAVEGFYGRIRPKDYEGLYGLNFLKSKHPGDYKAVQWFNDNVTGQPVILEASGDSYSEYCRISMATGLPTVQGWFVHEWLWRNDHEIVQNRVDEVKQVYESEDMQATIDILKKYEVEYVIIGLLEKKRYEDIKQEKLLELAEEVFTFEDTIVIKVKAL